MPLPLFLPCAAGVEPLLATEIRSLLPQADVVEARGGVALSGDPFEVMTLNLESRLAQRVLIEVGSCDYRGEQELYDLARGVDWSEWMTPRHTLRVDTTVHRSPLRSVNFAALRVKDAVCDMLRDATGQRPSVDTQHPDLQLVLREIADELGLHESTISRVTTAKYMSTPFGTFELKYFFGSSLNTEAGGNASSTAVRALIKQLVSAEDPGKPLSDSQISDMLKEQGIECARRTVAKYREALRIAPANLRKSL